jgi:hypothetical protein
MTIGFVATASGDLIANADVTLTPIDGGKIIGGCYRLKVSLPDGNAVIAVVSKSAVKITREEGKTV